MSKTVGISRNVKLEWLDKVAELYIAGNTEEEIRSELDEYLSLDIKSETNRRKTRTILTKTWVEDIEGMEESKDIAIRLFKTGKEKNKLLAHWCLMIMTYPMFRDLCKSIGRMDRNMFPITTRDIKKRMFDIWGERSTLNHAVDKNIQTLRDMNILYPRCNGEYGINQIEIDDSEGLLLIANVLVYGKGNLYISVESLNESAEFFPFIYCITTDILEQNSLISVDRFGGELVVSRA